MKNEAVIYARSSNHSSNGLNIEGQIKECYAFAERNSLHIVGEYIDHASAGMTECRPEFLRMVEDGKKKRFEAVIVYQFERFARSREACAHYKARFKKNGVQVFSACESISEDASGILMEAILEGMAQYYATELSQKIKRGLSISATKCKFLGGNVPWGYKVDENRNLILDEDIAPIIKTVFEKFTSGYNCGEIGDFLSEHNIINANGYKISNRSLRRILSNRRYLGKYIYQNTEIDGGIPRIIDDELFAKAQDNLAQACTIKNKNLEETR